MKQIIHRNYNRTEHDDFVLNIQPILDYGNKLEAVPLYYEDSIVAWKIQSQYE